MRERERGGDVQRDQKVVESGGGNTVAAAVVFHWRLERVGVLRSLGARKHVWSHDLRATLFRSLWELTASRT